MTDANISTAKASVSHAEGKKCALDNVVDFDNRGTSNNPKNPDEDNDATATETKSPTTEKTAKKRKTIHKWSHPSLPTISLHLLKKIINEIFRHVPLVHRVFCCNPLCTSMPFTFILKKCPLHCTRHLLSGDPERDGTELRYTLEVGNAGNGWNEGDGRTKGRTNGRTDGRTERIAQVWKTRPQLMCCALV